MPETLKGYLVTRDVISTLGLCLRAFGAVELFRMVDPTDGRLGHA